MSIYDDQAHQFLKETKTTLTTTFIGKLLPSWPDSKPVKTLYVTIKNERHSYSFNFYCSLNDTYGPALDRRTVCALDKDVIKWNREQRNKDYNYDILACLNVDHLEDFEEFCDEHGYSDDSIKARDTYLAVRKETKNLKRLWTSEELEKLGEIS